MPEVVRSNGSLDEFLSALIAQSAPAPKPTATQTVLGMRAAMMGQTPVAKPALVPGYADGTAKVVPQDQAGSALAAYLSSASEGKTLASYLADPNAPLPNLTMEGEAMPVSPTVLSLAQGASRNAASAGQNVIQGNIGAALGDVGGGLVKLAAAPVAAVADAVVPGAATIADQVAGFFGVAPGKLKDTIAAQLTSQGTPVTTAQTGEHGAKKPTFKEFYEANKHLTNNQAIQLIGAMPKVQTPAQQAIAQLVNSHDAVFQRDMAMANQITDQAKRAKAQDEANLKMRKGLLEAVNAGAGQLGYVTGKTGTE